MMNNVDGFNRLRRITITTLVVGLLGTTALGCGDVVTGTSVPGEIDVRNLDTGAYPTLPVDAHDDPIRAPFYDMRQVAGMRLADHTATADEIDPALKYTLENDVSFDPIDTGFDKFGTELEAIAENNGYLYAFTSGGSSAPVYITQSAGRWPTKRDRGATSLTSLILQFPDDVAAERVAQQIHDRDLTAFVEQNEPVTLAEYPAAHSHWNPESPFLRSTIARGAYVVVYQVSTPSNDLGALSSLIEKAYDVQLPLLDQLPPITDIQVLSLPWDTDRLVVRAMDPLNNGKPSLGDTSVNVGLRGLLHVAPDRMTARASYTAMSATRFGTAGESVVVRTESYETARKAVDDKLFPFATTRAADPVPNIPDSACAETPEEFGSARFDRFVCMVAYHNYVGIVNSDQLIDVHQRAAAQYSILANGR